MFNWMAPERHDLLIDAFIAITFGVAFVVALVGCSFCYKKWAKFKEQRRQRQESVNTTSVHSSGIEEFAVFPSQSNAIQSNISTLSAAILDEIVFEPLPEIRSRNLQAIAQNIRPARFTGVLGKISLHDWFDEHQLNFPRNQLKYLKEVGSAWYGQAVEGEAYNIIPNEEKTKIVVKILRVDATVVEYKQFLHEARCFRDLQHPNLLRLMGRCLEVHPFLLIMDHCDLNLKTYLIQQRKSPEILLGDGFILSIACNISAALQYMHERGHIHSDVAAHSCLINNDGTVKVGDYGTALYTHKSDYYCLGDIAFPLRWCAPESLYCTDSIIEAKDITREANVWSFGVLLWELLEFGKLPYFDFADDEVVQKVIIKRNLNLEQPKTPCVHKDMIFNIMQLCWLPASHRPSIQKITHLLNYLYDNKDVVSESSVFESKWNSLQSLYCNRIVVSTSAVVYTRFENDFNGKADQEHIRDCDSALSNELYPNKFGNKSLSHESFSTGYESGLWTEISPSLQNLRGSIEDLTPVSSITKEHDVEVAKLPDYVDDSEDINATITEAIKDLDAILAAELPSSDVSKCTTPEASLTEGFNADSNLEESENSSSTVSNGNKIVCENVLHSEENTNTWSYVSNNGDIKPDNVSKSHYGKIAASEH